MPSPEPDPHADFSLNLGNRLRQARLEAQLSLREMARRLGVSPSFVSQLENGKSQPSVATLYSLAQLLDVSIDRLFEPGTPAPEVAAPVTGAATRDRAQPGPPADVETPRPGDRSRLSVTAPGGRTRLVMDSGVVWEQLARNTDENLDFIEVTYPAGSSSTTDDRMLRHDGHEYCYLLEGRLHVTLGFEEFILTAGEAMGLDSSIPHLFRNVGTTPARGIWFVQHRSD
jgi:transcriptional regulator with XRE-family HTH domain/quercetin dioxygenase-like cupin family protein